jgi:hypothetical protein
MLLIVLKIKSTKLMQILVSCEEYYMSYTLLIWFLVKEKYWNSIIYKIDALSNNWSDAYSLFCFNMV